MRIDNDLFSDLLDNYKQNIINFKQQNSGFIINDIRDVTEQDVEKFINNLLHLENSDVVIDRQFIREHFRSFGIVPVINELQKGFSMQVDLIPDIICESYK